MSVVDHSKRIYLSYAEPDREVAFRLHSVFGALLGNQVYIRDFDLNGGELVAQAISEAVGQANWFVIVLSKNSINSNWLKREADIATLRSVESEDFRIAVVKIDDITYPWYIEAAFKNQFTVNTSRDGDIENDFLRLAEYIDQTDTTKFSADIYVDRGGDTDKFSLVHRKSKIVFILGWAGIGKTSFVINSISKLLNKKPIDIRLSRGHSIDYLARQIIEKAHARQPLDGEISEQEWLDKAFVVLKSRAERQFLFLDNAEEAFDTLNAPLPFLGLFLEQFVKSDIKTHVILATTRVPEFSVLLSTSGDLFRLEGLEDQYILQAMELWLLDTGRSEMIFSSSLIKDLVEMIGGHPLAARMLSTYLKVKSPEDLLGTRQRRDFQLKFAEYVLKSVDKSVLSPVHQAILNALATIKEPIAIDDLLSVASVKRFPLDEIKQAKIQLADWFFIEQRGELMFLHNFLSTYFQDQLERVENQRLRDKIASDFSSYAYDKIIQLGQQISSVRDDEEKLARVTNEIFRYAAPTGRLLRSIGKNELADRLPIQIKGTVREMVFFFYQERRDYRTAMVYAQNWLRIYPDDTEVTLLLARCYRNFREKSSLDKAKAILGRLVDISGNRRFLSRIYRERALIAEFSEDHDLAKEYYRKGMEIDEINPYPENYSGLARLLLKEIDDYPYDSNERREIAEEAVRLLEVARRGSATFDRFHLGVYIEALFQARRENTALPLLYEALEDNPKDERLNFRMAEILRKQERFSEAVEFGLRAHRYGIETALISVANTLYGYAMVLMNQGNSIEARIKLREALETIDKFQPKNRRDHFVVDTVKSKVYRLLGEYENAHLSIGKYQSVYDDPYVIYEQAQIDLWEARTAEAKKQYDIALKAVRTALERVALYKYDLTSQLLELRRDAKNLELHFSSLLNTEKGGD